MELTCWWNQLWIIFMNMKSITAAAAINQFNHLFSLRMRKERLIGLICCFAAGSEIWKSLIFNGAAAEERTMKFISSFLLWWVMGAAAPMAPPKRENKEEMNEWVSDDQQKREWIAFSFFLERQSARNEVKWWWSGKEEKQWTQHQRAKARRQAHSATLLFVGPLCALKKEDNCWNGSGGPEAA